MISCKAKNKNHQGWINIFSFYKKVGYFGFFRIYIPNYFIKLLSFNFYLKSGFGNNKSGRDNIPNGINDRLNPGIIAQPWF
ncbi:hypothetical protein O185_09770 [Photorhabdus temperata J3]|uniref:Uncharacterized protein n=1 Tax=Photorhabdus temperata J3 TaxID=1389415 RepID=U7R1A5_PHOTE|nr:hypothetical protein O185_09770 [Photorhabdus temperata J3]